MPAVETKAVSGVTYTKYVEPITQVYTGGNEALRQFPAPNGLDGAIASVLAIDTETHTVRGSIFVWAKDDLGADNDETIIFPDDTIIGSWLRIFAPPV